MSEFLVVDEWIWEEEILRDQEKQNIAFKFLNKVYEKCDCLVIVKNSPFVKKFNTLCKRQHQAQDQIVRGIIKLFKDCFLYNLKKCIKYEETELRPLSDFPVSDFPDIEKEVKEDDRYLVRASLTAQTSTRTNVLLITTDKPLIEVVSKYSTKYSISCKHVDEFLHWYIGGKANT